MMNTCRFQLIVIMIAVLTATSVSAAQVNFTPELTLSEEYSDNLFLTNDDDSKVDDYITTVGLSLTTEVLGRSAGLTLNVSPSYNKFADNDELDYWRHFASLGIWNEFSRTTRLEFNSTYLETEDPRDQSGEDDEESDETGEAIEVDLTRRDRDRYLRNFNELRLTHQYASRSTLYGAVEYNLHRDIDAATGVELDDYDEIRPSFGIENWFNSNWGMEIEAYYSDRAYEDRDDRAEYFGSARLLRSFNRRLSGYVLVEYTTLDFDEEIADEDYTITAPSIGILYQLSEESTISAGAGYYIQGFQDSDDVTGSFIDASLRHSWIFPTGNIDLLITSGYDIEDTGAEDLGLQIFYEGRIDAGYNFSSRLSSEVYLSYRHDDYPNQEPDRSDQTMSAGAGLSYQALRWMLLSLSYDYDQVVSDIDTEEFTENRVTFTITMVPSSPYRLN